MKTKDLEMYKRRYKHIKILVSDLDNQLSFKYNSIVHNKKIKLESDLISLNRLISLALAKESKSLF